MLRSIVTHASRYPYWLLGSLMIASITLCACASMPNKVDGQGNQINGNGNNVDGNNNSVKGWGNSVVGNGNSAN